MELGRYPQASAGRPRHGNHRLDAELPSLARIADAGSDERGVGSAMGLSGWNG